MDAKFGRDIFLNDKLDILIPARKFGVLRKDSQWKQQGAPNVKAVFVC